MALQGSLNEIKVSSRGAGANESVDFSPIIDTATSLIRGNTAQRNQEKAAQRKRDEAATVGSFEVGEIDADLANALGKAGMSDEETSSFLKGHVDQAAILSRMSDSGSISDQVKASIEGNIRFRKAVAKNPHLSKQLNAVYGQLNERGKVAGIADLQRSEAANKAAVEAKRNKEFTDQAVAGMTANGEGALAMRLSDEDNQYHWFNSQAYKNTVHVKQTQEKVDKLSAEGKLDDLENAPIQAAWANNFLYEGIDDFNNFIDQLQATDNPAEAVQAVHRTMLEWKVKFRANTPNLTDAERAFFENDMTEMVEASIDSINGKIKADELQKTRTRLDISRFRRQEEDAEARKKILGSTEEQAERELLSTIIRDRNTSANTLKVVQELSRDGNQNSYVGRKLSGPVTNIIVSKIIGNMTGEKDVLRHDGPLPADLSGIDRIESAMAALVISDKTKTASVESLRKLTGNMTTAIEQLGPEGSARNRQVNKSFIDTATDPEVAKLIHDNPQIYFPLAKGARGEMQAQLVEGLTEQAERIATHWAPRTGPEEGPGLHFNVAKHVDIDKDALKSGRIVYKVAPETLGDMSASTISDLDQIVEDYNQEFSPSLSKSFLGYSNLLGSPGFSKVWSGLVRGKGSILLSDLVKEQPTVESN